MERNNTLLSKVCMDCITLRYPFGRTHSYTVVALPNVIKFTANNGRREYLEFRGKAKMLGHKSVHIQQSFSVRLRIMFVLALVLAVLPVKTISAAEQETIIPKSVVDSSVWKAIWRNHYTGTQGVEMLLHSAFLVQLYKNSPTLDAQQAINRINELQQKYSAAMTRGQDANYRPRKSYDEVVRTMFDAALDTPNLVGVVKSTWAIFVEQGSFPTLDSATSIAAMTQRFELADSLREREESVLGAVLDLAQQNTRFADAYDQLTGLALNASIKNLDATKLLVAHPAVYVPPRIREHILPDGSVSISLDELKGLSQTEFDRLNATLTNLRSTLVTIDANQQVLLDYVKDQKKREAMEALAKTTAEEEKLALDARKSAISIISTFVGLQDEKMGKAISTVFTSGIEIGDALEKWLTATAKLDGLEKLTDLSAIVMTGNVLGAVMNVVNLFKGAGPSKEDLILQSIGKLRQQIDDLHKDMDRRFDRIDRELNTIFTTMQDRFNLIDLQLGKINGNVQEIQRTLIGIELTLSRIERNNYEFLNVGFRRPLLDAINGAIDYEARTGAVMPYQPDFVNNENVFQSWGTIHAFDALSAGPIQRNFGDGQVLAELNAFPLDANINYLNGWLIAHGLTPFAAERLANPRDWTFASRAYAQMGLDWPQHTQRINPQRQAALDGVGAKLDAAMRNISTLSTPGGPQGNTPLFTGVITYYNSKLAQLDSALLSHSTAFTQEVQLVRLKRDKPFDLWGGVAQTLTYQAPEFDTMVCGVEGGIPFMGIPALRNLVPNMNRYMLAEYLKVGTLKVCLTAAWVDMTLLWCNPKLGCKYAWKYQFTIDVLFNGVSIERRSLKLDELEDSNGSAQSQAYPRWNNNPANRAKFETQSFSQPPTPELAAQRAELLSKVTTDVQTRLAEYQHELYGLLFNALSSGALHPVALELSGAKALLDSFITLGLPSAVANDDLLRSLLFGSQRVHDDGLATDTYALSFVQPITQVQIMTDTRVALNRLATERITALDGLLAQYLNAIGNSTRAEEFNMIADARLELRLAQRLAMLDETSKKNLVFLPLMQK